MRPGLWKAWCVSKRKVSGKVSLALEHKQGNHKATVP